MYPFIQNKMENVYGIQITILPLSTVPVTRVNKPHICFLYPTRVKNLKIVSNLNTCVSKIKPNVNNESFLNGTEKYSP